MGLIYGLTFARTGIWSLVYFFLPLLLEERGVVASWRGVLLALLMLSGVLFTAAAGVLADRLSPRPVVVAGLVLLATYFAGLSAFSAPWALVPVFLAGGLGFHMSQTASEVFVYKRVHSGHEATELALLVAVAVVAMALGIASGGALLERVATRWIVLGGALGFVALAAAATRLADLPASQLTARVYLHDLTRPRTLALLGYCFLTRVHWGAEATCYAPYLERVLDLERTYAGVFMAIPIALLGVAAFLTGRYLDRVGGRAKVLFWGTILAGVGHVGFASTDSLWIAFSWRVVHEIGEAMLLTAVLKEISATFPKDRVGGAAGAVGVTGAIAAGLGAVCSSPVAESLGYALPQQITGVLMLIALAFLIPLARPLPAPDESA